MRRFPVHMYLVLATTLSGCATTPAQAPAAPAACPPATAIHKHTIVDLTHAVHPDMPYWPGGVPFTMTRLVDYDQGYRLHKFEMGENTGTHVDAPSHFFQGKRSIDAISLTDLVVPVVVIHVQDQVARNPDYQLSADDVRAWEADNGVIAAGSLVILNTGWYRRFDDMKAYANMDDAKVMHFPGFSRGSAELLVERDVAGIGIDTLSLDYGPSQDFAAHQVMLAANKYQVENLANLDALPATGATVVVAVLPVRDGTQAQARVLAFMP